MTDTNVNLVAEFDSETKTIVPVHAGLSGSTLSLVKRVGERAKKIETKTDLAPITVKQQQGPHKAVRGLLKVPRKCKIEFKRVVMENKNQEAPLTGDVECISCDQDGTPFEVSYTGATTGVTCLHIFVDLPNLILPLIPVISGGGLE